jgi:hypothetical protein
MATQLILIFSPPFQRRFFFSKKTLGFVDSGRKAARLRKWSYCGSNFSSPRYAELPADGPGAFFMETSSYLITCWVNSPSGVLAGEPLFGNHCFVP